MTPHSGLWDWVDAAGVSLIELLMALTIALIATGLSLPVTLAARDDGRARQAAAFAAGDLRGAKEEAVRRNAAVGFVFSLDGSRWVYRRCIDGNGNGVRHVDVASGKDHCLEITDLATTFPGVQVAVDPGIPGPDGDPSSVDPVRFGTSDIASFSPDGGCTAGTLFLRSANGTQYAIRIAGVTGRLRVLRYNPGTHLWSET
jgi:type II secretory pathway pseudopilin PulG